MLHKLEKLPRSLRLRKIEKILGSAENRLAAKLPPAEGWDFLAGLAESLQEDALFTPPERAAFGEAAGVLRHGPADPGGVRQIRRALSTARHILVTGTGRSRADWDFTDPGGRLDPSGRRPFPGMFVYLEDIRSPFNVGAMFRSAESFGAEKLFISPLCTSPSHPRSQRSAMGCVDLVPWERRDLSAEDLAEWGGLFAMETGGTPLGEFAFPRRGILAAGSEEFGVSPEILAAADASLGRVSIPSYGAKGSLNVSVAFGIVMQAWSASMFFPRKK